jgi:hypothetical protein
MYPKKKKTTPKGGLLPLISQEQVAEPTGLEPATSDVTGRRSNQLNYDSALGIQCQLKSIRLQLHPVYWWAVLGSNQ